MKKEVKSQEIISFDRILLVEGGIRMPYFTIEKSYLFIPFELRVKQKELLNRFLLMLENSGVGEIIQKYVKNDTELGGRPNCNYHRLFAAILYGFAFDRFTLRELEDAFQYDLRYIYLMDYTQVDFTTICKFINKVIVPNEEIIFSAIMIQTSKEVGIALSESDAFIDGTKYQANANKYKFVWKPTKRHKKLSIKINEAIGKYKLLPNPKSEEFVTTDTVVNSLINLKYKRDELSPKEYKDLEKFLTAASLKINEYEEMYKVIGEGRKSFYKTDKDATAMVLKEDYYSKSSYEFHAAYNVQQLVIRGFIFAYHISQSRTDIDDFIPINEQFYRLYQYFPKNECADAGYGSLDNYTYLDEHHIGNYVKHQSWEGNKSASSPDCYHLNDDDTITCLNNLTGIEIKLENRRPRKKEAVFYRVEGCNKCKWMPFCKRFMRRWDEDFKIFEVVKKLERYKYQSQNNLCSPKGIELRVNRSIQVEGDFGIIKQNYGYTRTRRRGIEKVSTEIMLTALGLNIAKLIRYYQTGKLNKFWIAPNNLEPEEFRKPSWKRLAKKGTKINKAQYENK